MTPDCRLTGAALVKKVSKVIELIRFSAARHRVLSILARRRWFALREITRKPANYRALKHSIPRKHTTFLHREHS